MSKAGGGVRTRSKRGKVALVYAGGGAAGAVSDVARTLGGSLDRLESMLRSAGAR